MYSQFMMHGQKNIKKIYVVFIDSINYYIIAKQRDGSCQTQS